MAEKMTQWGVGPKIMFPSFPYLVAALVLTARYPDFFRLSFFPKEVFWAAGCVLLAAGVPLWAVCVRTIFKGFPEGRLFTEGPYAWARHPLYAVFIGLIFPGLSLVFRSWPALFASLLAYGLFRVSIRAEEQYLEKEFGEEYLDYRTRVNSILPRRPYKEDP
jgi:protein-S-isoprenylcysteine O-methyltransferase Ste14